jgi:hypothetical protein
MRHFLSAAAAILILIPPFPTLAEQGAVPMRGSRLQAPVNARIDKRMVLAAFIARLKSPHEWTTLRCWHAVKSAMVEAGAIPSMPSSIYARDAGEELVAKYGFVRLNIRDPYLAPAGAVLVYGNKKREECHVELRTTDGFASDYSSVWRCKYNLIGVYAKFAR